MFFKYLRRELLGRKKQTAIISIGVGLALTLVILITSITSGIKTSQTEALEAVYGVGTDITVSQAATAPTGDSGGGGREQFEFGASDGEESGDTTSISTATLSLDRSTTAVDASTLDTVSNVTHVEAATSVLLLNNNSFSGQMPSRANDSTGTNTGNDSAAGETPANTGEAPAGGPDGSGDSSFSVDRFSVAGVQPGATETGILSSVTVDSGRMLTTEDAGTNVVVLDSSYATSVELAVDSTLSIAGTDFTVVGIVSPSTTGSATAANTYIPLGVAQTLSGETNKISTIYVKADSSSNIDQIKTDVEAALPDLTVNTQASLAETVNSSLTSVSEMFTTFGFWISILALAAAFLLSILFTVSGVARRTRELGTLKSIGWSNTRIVKQITGESVVQSLIGGLFGIVLGVISTIIINMVNPTVEAAAENTMGRPGQSQAASTVALTAELTPDIILLALGLAVFGGLIAAFFGSLRVAKLQPAEALRGI